MVTEGFETVPGYSRRWIGLLFVGISLLVISLDNTVLNVALPSISNDLGSSTSELQWIVDAYVLVFAALLLTMGSIGDRVGRKKALQWGLALFGIGSFVAARSTSTEMLIATRAFLGIGGAMIMPATLSIISATFPPKERPQAIALWAATFGLGIGIGPLVGGWLLEHYEWSAVFYLNLPVVTVAIIGDAWVLADSKDDHAPRPDIPGVLLSIAGLFALVYGIIEAGIDGWTGSTVLGAFALAFVLLAAFGWWEGHAANAMLPLQFFKNMSFTGASMALMFAMFSLFGSVFFISQYLQTVLGFTALEAGIRLLPLALTMAVTSALSARLAHRFGVKAIVAVGLLIAASGLYYMGRQYEIGTSYGTIVVGIVTLATGMGLTMSPATDSIMGAVPVAKAGVGSAMNDTTRMLGGALGVAVLGTIMNDRYLEEVETLHEALPQLPAAMFDVISDSVQAAHVVAHRMLAGVSLPIPDGLLESASRTILDTANRGFVVGMNDAMIVGSIVMALTSLFALFVLPSRVQRPAEEGASNAELALAASEHPSVVAPQN
ncbi:MAG TPA: MFS transporter [Aggregatilinea sp.]|uniref:MFS transporter n=1 Tax=Aggregatilinea sp. TaxID=2806333 RepID=UPI002B88B53A|nr:MFS transporter [Aggregatilinea sp.]HML24896.1 MFS transporter [Aggregatilinea sp.]